ncbi:hypothetical protein BGZ63DRAFT_394924 [Mariannaea sp. PMI_226]|nr:hypothetical protein BGZ63DRAFT_394924 [Mariannaea sp. PMI_226]
MEIVVSQMDQEVIIGPIVQHYGSMLQNLSIPLHVDGLMESYHNTIQVATHCPLLRQLNTTVKRSKGDTFEVATYAATGSLPLLQDVTLTLDCSDWDVFAWHEDHDDMRIEPEPPNDATFDEFDQRAFPDNVGHTYMSPRTDISGMHFSMVPLMKTS